MNNTNPTFPVYAAFSTFAVAAVLIGSWAPFQFRSAEIPVVWQEFIHQGFAIDSPRTDAVVNFWLGFPLVLGLSGLVRSHTGSWARRLTWIFFILALQACLSLIAEMGQGWYAPRVTSVTDFALQLGGASMATLFWQLRGQWVETQANLVFARPSNKQKWTRLDATLTLTAVGILLWTVMPFDLLVSPDELMKEFLKTEIVPFTRSAGSFWENLYQWLASFLLAVPLGLWLSRWLVRSQMKFSIVSVMLLSIATGMLPEICQFPIDSRVASATDALFGVLGSLAGILVASQFQSTRFHVAKANLRELVITPGFWFALAASQSLAICAIAWMPFDFSNQPNEVAQRFREYQSLPFSGCRGADLLNLLTLFRQAVLAGALGAFLGLGARFSRLNYPLSLYFAFAIVLFILVFSIGVEFGQLVIDSRTGESIGIFIRSAGSILGLVCIMALPLPSEIIAGE